MSPVSFCFSDVASRKSRATDRPGVRFLLAGWSRPTRGLAPSGLPLGFWPSSQVYLLLGARTCWARPGQGAEVDGETDTCQGVAALAAGEWAIYSGW